MKRIGLSDVLTGLAIGALLLLIIVAFAQTGIALHGGLDAWHAAWAAATPYLRLWRAALYSALLGMWLWLYRHPRTRPESRKRIRRIGLQGFGACAVIEIIHAGLA